MLLDRMKKRYRLGVFVAGAVLASFSMQARADNAPQKITYQQAFAPSASDMPLYVAAAKGFFSDEGLDVDIRRSQDASNSVAMVAVGEAEIGMAYPPDVMLATQKGMPLKAIWAWDQVNKIGIVSLATDANIREPKDLIGKNIGLTSLPMDQMFFDVMLAQAGLDRKQMKIVNPGFSGGDLVGEGKLDGASGVPWYEVDGLKAVGRTPVLMSYADNGAPDYPYKVLITNNSFAEKNPEALRGFLRSIDKALKFIDENPTDSLDILLEAVPTMNRDRQAAAATTVASLRVSEDTDKHGMGYINMEKVQGLADFLHERGLLKDASQVPVVFTNDYR